MAENTENNEATENTEEMNAAGEGAETIEEEEKITPEIDSKYRFILLAAQRTKQLQRGAEVRIGNVDVKKTKPTRIATEEFKQKKVHFELLVEED